VKVLDFGLAKAFQPDASDPNMSLSPTISLTAAATQMGMVIGTAAYMAPEQAKGKPVDTRADTWAFGAVLFEMLTGQKPFAGDDVSDTLALVLKFEPDWAALPAETPARIRRLIQTCLDKHPKQRVQAIGDVRLVMEGTFETAVSAPSDRTAQPRLRVWQRPLVAIGIPVAAVLIASFTVWSLMRPGPPPASPVAKFSVLLGLDQTLTRSGRPVVALSPDGSQLVYVANRQLFVRRFDQLQAIAIPGTQEDPGTPFISPDGKWQVSSNVGVNPVWSPDGGALFFRGSPNNATRLRADRQGAMRVAEVETEPTFNPGTPTQMFDVSGYSMLGPSRQYDVAPDGERFLMRKVEGVQFASGNVEMVVV